MINLNETPDAIALLENDDVVMIDGRQYTVGRMSRLGVYFYDAATPAEDSLYVRLTEGVQPALATNDEWIMAIRLGKYSHDCNK